MSNKLWTSRQKKLQKLLKQIRLNADLTQTELAVKLKMPQSYISKYESGERRLDILEVHDICKACGTNLENFVQLLK